METLLIRILPDTPETENVVEWAISGSGFYAGDETLRGELADVAELTKQRRVILVVPTEDVVLASASLPVRNRQQLMQAVPYALEEGLAEDIEALHFALGPRQADDVHPVAIVARERMDDWMARIDEAGILPRRIIPDVFLLPRTSESVSVLIEGDRALCRTGEFSGFAIDADTLPVLFGDALTSMEPAPRVIDVLRCGESTAALFDGEAPADVTIDEQETCLANLMGIAPDEKRCINLIQGSYQASDNVGNMLWPWRVAAALLAAWLLVITITGFVDYRRLQAEDKMLTSAIQQEFKKSFPKITRIVNARVQMEQELKTLRAAAGGGGAGFLALLDAGGKTVKAASNVDIDNFTFRDNQLEVSVNAKDMQGLDSIKEELRKAGVDASIESADTRANKVTARLRLKGATP